MSEYELTFDEAIGGVREVESVPALFELLQQIFRLGQSSLESYENLEDLAERLALSPSPVDLYDLKVGYAAASPPVRDAFNADSRYAELRQMAEGISGKEVKDFLEESGDAVFNRHKTLIGRLDRGKACSRKAQKEASRIENDRFLWMREIRPKKLAANKRYGRISEEIDLLEAKKREIWKGYSSSIFSEEDLSAIGKQLEGLFREKYELEAALEKELEAEMELHFPGRDQALKRCRKAQEEVTECEDAVFQSVTSDLAVASGITEERAQVWAENNIIVADNAKAKLRRIGYPLEKLRQDAAELYRYVGGKLGPIEFVLEGRSSRAFARGKTLIAVQGAFNKEALFHECGHLVEAWDSASRAACLRFVSDRAKGKPISLKKLTGQGYNSTEKAYPDEFFHPYVGKYYSYGASEVLSMALQCLSSPKSLATLIEKDPEHFKLLLGVCGRTNPSLVRQLSAAEAKAIQHVQELDRGKIWEKALNKVAGPALNKLLQNEDGYKGYQISAWGRGGTLYRILNEESREFICSSGVIGLRRVAYLLIAHDEELLPFRYDDPRTASRNMINLVFSGGAPGWFDPAVPLPKV